MSLDFAPPPYADEMDFAKEWTKLHNVGSARLTFVETDEAPPIACQAVFALTEHRQFGSRVLPREVWITVKYAPTKDAPFTKRVAVALSEPRGGNSWQRRFAMWRMRRALRILNHAIPHLTQQPLS